MTSIEITSSMCKGTIDYSSLMKLTREAAGKLIDCRFETVLNEVCFTESIDY